MSRPHLLAEKRNVLAAALRHAVFDGWGGGTLARAVADCGYDASMAARAFPGGTTELIDFHAAEGDRKLVAALAEHDLAAMRIRERIAFAVRTRLELATAEREAIRRG